MTNFSPGAMFKIGPENLQESVLHCAPLKRGLKFECHYMRFFSPVSQNGLEIPGQAETLFM